MKASWGSPAKSTPHSVISRSLRYPRSNPVDLILVQRVLVQRHACAYPAFNPEHERALVRLVHDDNTGDTEHCIPVRCQLQRTRMLSIIMAAGECACLVEERLDVLLVAYIG